MREILFKGKREDNREWICGMPCATEESGIYAIQTLEGGIFDIIPETVGQFTGLPDINNRKIFEGDIVKSYNAAGKMDGIGVVHWSDLFVSWHIAENRSMYSGHIAFYEVIGNIHDNKLEDFQNG
jgi:uncharacterized phage protein (TIGR01671 family)